MSNKAGFITRLSTIDPLQRTVFISTRLYHHNTSIVKCNGRKRIRGMWIQSEYGKITAGASGLVGHVLITLSQLVIARRGHCRDG